MSDRHVSPHVTERHVTWTCKYSTRILYPFLYCSWLLQFNKRFVNIITWIRTLVPRTVRTIFWSKIVKMSMRELDVDILVQYQYGSQ